MSDSNLWGNPESHGEAFRKAFDEFKRQHPEDRRRFHELEYKLQREILARQVEIYQQLSRKVSA